MPAFPLGTITITPLASAALAATALDPDILLARHQAGDWGDIDEDERHTNELALQRGHFLITDFHPVVIAAGWRTQFARAGITYLLPTAQHTRDDYLEALRQASFAIRSVHDVRVRDVPAGYFSAALIERDGDTPFCFVILAAKEAQVAR